MPRHPKVKITRNVQVGSRQFPVKHVDGFLGVLKDSVIEGTAIQIRLVSFFARDYVVDKLMAYVPKRGEILVVRKPSKPLKAGDSPPEVPWRKESDRELKKVRQRRHVFVAKRITREPRVKRVPFRNHPDLSKKHVDKKVRRGEDGRKLIATGDYITSIVVRQYKHPRTGVAYIVTVKNRKHLPSGLPLKVVALIHEMGTSEYSVPLFGNKKNMVKIAQPPRPHWRPTIKAVKRELRSLEENVSAEILRVALEKLK